MSETYTTKQGDMWDSIAHHQLGSTSHTGALMRRNARYLTFCTFPAGIVLTLPDVAETASPTLPPWKQAAG